MTFKTNGMTVNILKEFIAPIANFPKSPKTKLMIPLQNRVELWETFFSEQFNFVVTPIQRPNNMMDAPLLLVEHEKFGPVIIKNQIHLLKKHQIEMLLLSTGDIVKEQAEKFELNKVTNFNILVDNFDWQGEITATTLIDYIYLPLKKANKPIAKLNFLSSLLISLMFMSGLDTLNYIVPTHSFTSYFNLAILIAALIIIFCCSRYLLLRAQVWIDSIAMQRQQHLFLSMLGNIPKSDHKTLNELCYKVSQLAKLKINFVLITGSCIALLPLAVSVFVRLPFIMVIVPFILTMIVTIILIFENKKMTICANEYQQELQQSQLQLYGILKYIKPELFYRRISTAANEYQASYLKVLIAKNKLDKIQTNNEYLQQFFQGLAICVAILITQKMVSEDLSSPTLTIGNAYMILYLVNTIFKSFPRLVKAVEIKIDIKAYVDEIDQNLEDMSKGINQNALRLANLDIEIHDLRLPHQCLFTKTDTLTTKLVPNQLIDISGPSGSGKSTFLRCLLGIELPHSGEIRIGSLVPSEMSTREKNQLFAYLSQTTHLVSGSIRENLTLLASKPNTDKDIWQKLATVKLQDKIQALPLGLSTPLMSAGSAFSTGECQRILLAQLLFKPAKILILDEAMSGIPESMEREILQKLKIDYAFIFRVSHRDGSRDLSDNIIELEKRT